MAPQAVSPETPPASGVCCLLKLPPELRVVIYNMLFEGLRFEGEEGMEGKVYDLMTAKHTEIERAVKTLRRLVQIKTGDDSDGVSDSSQNNDEDGGDDEDGSDERSDNEEEVVSVIEEHEEDGTEPESSIHSESAETSDEDDGREEEVISETENEISDEDASTKAVAQGQDKADNEPEHGAGVQDEEHKNGDEPQAASPQAIDGPIQDLHLTRPPFLATCKQIRKEAIPVYSDALAVLATNTLSFTNDTITMSKKIVEKIGEDPGFLEALIVHALKSKLMHMGDLTKNRVVSIAEEIASVEGSVCGSIVRSKQTQGRLAMAAAQLIMLIFDVTGVGPDEYLA